MSWKEEFDKQFNPEFNGDEFKVVNLNGEYYLSGKVDDVKQFISDLRKKDEEELIKMMPREKKRSNEYEESYNATIDSSNSVIWRIKKLIKSYYKD